MHRELTIILALVPVIPYLFLGGLSLYQKRLERKKETLLKLGS